MLTLLVDLEPNFDLQADYSLPPVGHGF